MASSILFKFEISKQSVRGLLFCHSQKRIGNLVNRPRWSFSQTDLTDKSRSLIFVKDAWKSWEKQTSIGVFIKKCSENMQQIFRRISMLNCGFQCSEYTGEHPCQNVISLWHGCSPVNWLHWKPHFDMGILLKTCCIFSENFFIKTPMEVCFIEITLWYASSHVKLQHIFRIRFRKNTSFFSFFFCCLFNVNLQYLQY